MKSLFKTSIFIILATSVISCADNSEPNYQFMPNMYEPVPYEPYGAYDVFVNEQEAKLPVEGTVSRGWKPYDYENSMEGYAAAKANLENPLSYTEENLNKGEALYTIYCAICHGDKGDGKGPLVQREKILGIPSYDDAGRAITEGSVYHVMYYGLNAMGSYASQTSIEERWLIDHYVMKLKNDLEGGPERAFEQETDLIPAVNAEKEMITKETSTTGEEDNQNEE
ncbi:c-type cytochrome [Salinimicrobium gaetbulicola]|uniref:C-type cytochrome n=1 Tax=Salinimicrobium gaetbulicola TaxID=999702 RepID=A0ABW3IFS3_9FLAO